MKRGGGGGKIFNTLLRLIRHIYKCKHNLKSLAYTLFLSLQHVRSTHMNWPSHTLYSWVLKGRVLQKTSAQDCFILVCTHVCVHIYMHSHIHVCVYTCIHTHTYCCDTTYTPATLTQANRFPPTTFSLGLLTTNSRPWAMTSFGVSSGTYVTVYKSLRTMKATW